VEDATWEGNDDSHLFPLDNSQAITGAVQAVWQQAKFFQGLTPDLQKVILQTGKDITLFHNNLQNKMENQWCIVGDHRRPAFFAGDYPIFQ